MNEKRMLSFSVEALLGKGCESKKLESPAHNEGQNSAWRQSTTRPDRKPFEHERSTKNGKGNSLPAVNTCLPASLDENVQVELYSKDLWQQFHRIGNEMIITKAGRRMFPALKVKVTGLDPDAYYILWVDVVPVDDNRYRYVYPSSQWMVAGTGDPPLPQRHYAHSDSPANGRHWMAQFISFDRLKLTNNKQPQSKGQVSLHSMHKYQPRVHIMRTTDLQTDPESQMDPQRAMTFTFKETSFITVTAYQNQQITRLKIASNPFAKGFRDTVKTRDSCSPYERTRPGGKVFPEYPDVPGLPMHHHHRHTVPVPYPYLLTPTHPAFYAPTAFCSPCYPMDTCSHSFHPPPSLVLPSFSTPPCLITDCVSRSPDKVLAPAPHSNPQPKPYDVRPRMISSASSLPNQLWSYVPPPYNTTDFSSKM